jgi:hypothetical protein
LLDRRGFLAGLGALIAAPAIVRAGIIMPVKPSLILPPKLEIGTFPIEGRAIFGKIASFSEEWNLPEDIFSGDAAESWLRLKRRNEARFSEIQNQYGGILTEGNDG